MSSRFRPAMRLLLRRASLWLPGVLIAAGAIAALALYAVVLGKVFDHYVHPADDKARRDLLVTLGTFLAGTLALLGVFPAWRTLRINQEGQITTRYTQAVGQLGEEKREVRIGGIYALERIARDSEKDYQQIMEVLAAYIRENAPSAPKRPVTSRNGKLRRQSEASSGRDELRGRASVMVDVITRGVRPKQDIQAAISVLTRRRHHFGEGEVFKIDLRRTNLRGADLYQIHLEYAELQDIDVLRANLIGANLSGADLIGADLRGANLSKAILRGANLSGAGLKSVQGILWKQISQAVIAFNNSIIWRDGAGDRDALRRILSDYVVIPDEPGETVVPHPPAESAPENPN